MPPNILVIMSDDHARWATGCYGNPSIHTPNIDYLARTGVLMENAFTPTPVCSPARASFFTGRYPSQHGLHDFIKDNDPVTGDRAWLKDEITLAELLSAVGYQCGLSGKWHCGQNNRPQPGFEDWFTTGQTFPYHGGRHTYSDNGRPLEISGHKTQIITDRALRFLRQRDAQRPFFCFVGYTATHSPWHGHPDRLVDRYRHRSFAEIPAETSYPFGRIVWEGADEIEPGHPQAALAQYYAAVTQVDEAVGRLLDELEALAIREETLIVYTSDHGLNCGHHGLWGKGNGTHPQNVVEESIRIPLIFNRPGSLRGGQRRREMFDLCDLFMTLLDAAGAQPPDRQNAGDSLLPTLMDGRPVQGWKTTQIGEYGNLRFIHDGRYKLVRYYPNGPDLLIDLADDPRETTNLAATFDHQHTMEALEAELESFFTTIEDPIKRGTNVWSLPPCNPREIWRQQSNAHQLQE